ncbi:MAG: sodium:solute symporter family protein [Candidatus Marinimicrobia bacterium]|nr:sodium:solute symporter family protein [Candidatus Neomarinimicrobiota bacterium]
MKLHPIDTTIIVFYFILIWVLGFWKKSDTKIGDYILMGRRLTLPAFVMTLVSTWYGGILGVSEFSFSYGISNWIIFGVPYYVFGLFFAFFLAHRARLSQAETIPGLLRQNYGEASGKIGALWVFLLASPAPYLLTVAFLLQFFFGFGLILAMILGLVFSTLYILRGGLGAVVRTDMFQFLLMYLGFVTMAVIGWHTVGSFAHLKAMLPPEHLSLTGGHSFAYILVWFFIAMWTLVDPGFHQRVYATRDHRTARKGIILAVVCWFVFDLLTTWTGLLARALLPDLDNPAQAFLELSAHILPIGIQGLFLLGIFATVMSTLDSTTLVTAQTLGYDILARLKRFGSHNPVRLTQIGMGLSLGLAFVMAVFMPSVVNLWYTLGTLILPGLLLPVITSLVPILRVGKQYILWGMILGPLSAGVWYWFGKIDTWQYYWGLEPFYPGMLVGLFLWGMGLVNRKKSELSLRNH